jgi:hypothetical protein
MTDERIIMLENIGFIWDSHAAAWEEKLNELKEYTQLRGNWCVNICIYLERGESQPRMEWNEWISM